MSTALTLVVVCFYVPSIASLWETQHQELLYTEGMVTKRAFGPFNGPADVATCVCMAVPIALALLVHKPRRGSSTLVGLLLLSASFAALIAAKTRSGIVGLTVMFVLMMLLSRRRKIIIAVEVVIVLIAASYLIGGEVIGAARERLTTQQLGDDLPTRIDIWRRTITQPSPWILFFGEGPRAFHLRIGTTPHNGYLDALFVWGCGGFIMFALVAWNGVRWSSLVQRLAQDSRVRAAAWGLTWSFVAIGGLAMVSDPWYSSFYRLIVYFLLVVVCGKYQELRNRSPVSNVGSLTVGVPDKQRSRGVSGVFLNPQAKLPHAS